MYNEIVIDRFKKVKNSGLLKGSNGVGMVENLSSGDILKIYLKVDEDEVITDAKFKTFGCVAAISSSDVAVDLIKNKKIDDALNVSSKDIIQKLVELPDEKNACAVLAEEAIKNAVEDYRKRKIKEELKKQKNKEKIENIDDTENRLTNLN